MRPDRYNTVPSGDPRFQERIDWDSVSAVTETTAKLADRLVRSLKAGQTLVIDRYEDRDEETFRARVIDRPDQGGDTANWSWEGSE